MDNKAKKLGILTDPIYVMHNPGIWHPESPQRLAAVDEAINELDLEITPIAARPATIEQLCLVHTKPYVEKILDLKIEDYVSLDPDTVISKHSIEAALKAAGGVLQAVDMVLDSNIDRAFCAVRPPGHHAESNRSMGFCIFNNIAVAAAYAVKLKNINRVAIVDWDLHHGNGTQNAFYESDKVLYISTHQYPYFPGTGSIHEIGRDEGLGYNINLPMTVGSGDDVFQKAFDDIIIPALSNFAPELIFISAGFDAHYADPLGGLNLSSEFFGRMTGMIADIADKYSNGRIVSVLEGGYDFDALRDSVKYHLEELAK